MAKVRAARPTGLIDIQIVGNSDQVDTMLKYLDTALNPLALVNFLTYDVSPWLGERAEMRFRGEGDDAVGQWAPLKPTTNAIRQSKGFPPVHPINLRTGELENYILSGTFSQAVPNSIGATLAFPGPGAPGAGSRNVRKKMETAQIGRNGKPRTVPRPVLGMNEKDLTYVLTALAFHLGSGGNP